MRARVIGTIPIIAVACWPVVRDFDVSMSNRIEVALGLLLYDSDRRHVSDRLILAQGVSEFGAQSA